jgi:hypothetical protein
MYSLLCQPTILPPPSPQAQDVMMMGVRTCRVVIVRPTQKDNVYELEIVKEAPPLTVD